jgi:periplasmic divalent cation tolerance protein
MTNKTRDQEIVILVTAASEEEAAKIGGALVEAGLVACANILPRIRSVFFWEGKVAHEQESLLLLKSRAAHFEKVVTTVTSMHSYSVPEVIALPVTMGSAPYLAWIHETTNRK